MKAFRLLGFAYFGYFGVLALLVPYLGVFLDALGFNSKEIGELIAYATLCRIIGPPLWATYTDRTGKRLPIMRFAVLISLVFLSVLYFAESYIQVAFVLGGMSLFWSAILPQLEVVTLNTLGDQHQRYSKIRLGGSIGFIIVALVAAELMAWGGKTSFPLLAALLLLPLAVVVFLLREPNIKPVETSEIDTESLWTAVFSRPFIMFMASSILLQLSFAPFYAFFALYLGQLGYDPTAVGIIIALGVAAEVVMFAVAGRIVGRFRVSRILALCMGLTAIRWWALASFADILVLLVLVQLIHAFSFALHHSTAMRFIHRHFQQKHQGRGQAIYVSVGFAGGGAIGAYISGILWQDGAGADLTYLAASISAFLGMLAAFGVARPKHERLQNSTNH
ncbi:MULTISPECIES: MFS transporter [Gammaproteobacteria]|uniref:MFS transporter n=1 Tax=Gammaproteobacteria TaxID=1236 RepID=UPI000DD08B55|nr:MULTISPECIES: MFS transporter [Gammaproteobacteria]RTE87392.1 MFS transporter [Aliidiomarina sp. B3213]TCZ92822.1 MFS transporter [Lysobacter sp. N42]